jgi:hypothetical protein
VDLKQGEILCDRCNGSCINYDPEFVEIWGLTDCPKCWGKGKLSWVDNLVGIRDPYYEPADGVI